MHSLISRNIYLEELRNDATRNARRTVTPSRLRVVLPLSPMEDLSEAIPVACRRCGAADLYPTPALRPAVILCRSCDSAETPFP
jgi:hypothetical protein